MSKTLEKSMEDMAWAIANKAHAGQVYVRRDCEWEYITHIKRVAHALKDAPIEFRITGILHDVVEDSDITSNEVGDIFGDVVGAAVYCLSRRDDEKYEDYILGCRSNTVAKAVKGVDIADHITHCVRPDAPHNWRSMLDRYSAALRLLYNLS